MTRNGNNTHLENEGDFLIQCTHKGRHLILWKVCEVLVEGRLEVEAVLTVMDDFRIVVLPKFAWVGLLFDDLKTDGLSLARTIVKNLVYKTT